MVRKPGRLNGSTNHTSQPPATETVATFISRLHYKKIALSKTDKNNSKRCICTACKDSGFTYGNNPVLIEDDNPLVFSFLGKELVK